MEKISFGVYAAIALVLFAAAFLAIVIGTVLKSRATTRHEAHLPLEDGTPRKDENG